MTDLKYVNQCDLHDILQDYQDGKISYKEVVLLIALYRGKDKSNGEID